MHEAFKALGDPHRLEIVRLALAEPRHVQALADALGISQPAVSRHLGILERAGLIALTRNGRRTEVQAPPVDPRPEIATLLSLIGTNPRRAPEVHAHADRIGTGDTRPVSRYPVREELDDYLL